MADNSIFYHDSVQIGTMTEILTFEFNFLEENKAA